MGNSLIPNTNINKEAVGNCGANTQWVMHQGVRTDKTKDQVTVFLFDKRTISKQSSSSKEEFINGLKRDPHILAKFKNDGIVTLVNPLLEDQKRIGFVTEPIKTPLNVLIDKNTTDQIVQSDLEIKLHILDIAETLAYLQSDAKAAHLAVSPENIYITSEGRWKLGGFLFSTQILPGDSTPCPVDFTEKSGHIRLTPNLKFTAPEVTESPSRCTFTSDMFSLACLIFTLYKIKADGSARDPYLIKASSLHGYREIIQHLHRFDYSPVPEQIRPVLMRMLHSDPNMRITAAEFVNNNWFKDPFVQTVKCLETIHQRDLNQQSAFLKGLSTIILKFEARFLKAKMIPVLNNLVRNAQLAASVLPVYFTIMDQQNPPLINREEFNTLIWPSIKLLVTAKEISAAALFLLIQKLGLFVGYLDIKEIEKVFIPILLKSLGCGVQKLQDLAIQQTVMIFDKIDYGVLKAQIMPKILELCLDGNVDLRKSAVLMLSKSFHVYDSVMINDQILPTLDKLRKLNNNYAINMAMLTVFQGIAKDIGTETIANKILVSLIPMLVVQTISKSEYKAFLSTIYSYLKRIEDEQNRRYEGMPDKPPEEAQAEFEKSSSLQPQSQPPASEGQFGGDFAFLNSTVPKGPEVSSSKGEFDFSAFNTYNQQASGQSQISTQPSRASYDVKPSTNTFGLNNNAIQNRASVSTQKVPAAQTQSTSADKPLGFNNLGPSAGAKSVTVQQSDPFKDFSQSNQGVGQTSLNTIQGNKPQNPFAKTNPFSQTNPFGAAPAPNKQNTSSFDAFQSFEQFGSQPKKEVQQQPFSSQWGQPTNAQNAQPSAAGWDNLDQELESFSTTLARPTFASKPPEKVSQDNFGFGFDSNVNQAPAANKQQQQLQSQASQSWSQPQPQSQPQPSYQEQQYQQQQEQYYQQQQYQQQNEYQQSQNQYGGSYQNEYPQEEPHYDYQQDPNQYGMNNENQFAQAQNEPPVQENPEQREADIIATVGANHPLRYLGSNMNMGLSAIRGKR